MASQPDPFLPFVQIEPIDRTVGKDNGKFLGELAERNLTRAQCRSLWRTNWPQACPKLIEANLTWRGK